MTLTHACIVERATRTIEDMIYTRLEHDSKRPWYGELLQQVIFVYSYGIEHSRIHMTPNQAIKPKSEDIVRRILKKHALYNRTYPGVKVGGTVRIYVEKHIFDESWSKNRSAVEEAVGK